MDNKDKVKVQIERDLANKLKSMMAVGETYSDIIRRLLNASHKND